MREFALRRPHTVVEAVELLAGGAIPYTGGTELLAVMAMGLAQPETLVDLKRVDDLSGISESDSDIVLRARTTHREAHCSPVVQRHAPVLAVATHALGNVRVRATGTLAGNLCFAEPRSDVITALFALRARVELRSCSGSRVVDIEDFVEGSFSTAREETELLTSVRVPKSMAHSTYLRFQPTEYPTVTVAIVAAGDGGSCRVVVGAVGERPGVFDFDAVGDVDEFDIAQRVDVTEDLNGREDYKRHLTSVFVRRALQQVEVSRG